MAYTQFPDYVDQPGQLNALNLGGVGHYWQNGTLHVSDIEAAKFVVSKYNPLSHVQKIAVTVVKKTLTNMISSGFPYKGVLIAIDTEGLQNINQQSSVATNILTGLTTVPWKSSTVWLPQGNGPSLSLATPQDMITFHSTVSNYVSDLVIHADSLEKEIMAATTVAAVEAINTATGWPTS